MNNNKIELNLNINAIPQPNTSSSITNNTKIEKRFVVRLRGLPWSARDEEVAQFFSEEDVKEVQIAFLGDGRASGEALVEFTDEISYDNSFHKNKQHIGVRYIEIFKATGIEIDTAAGRKTHLPITHIPKSRYVIRMRGLPYSATKEDVSMFFQNIHLADIYFIKDDLGRPSGEGYAEFFSETDIIAGMAKHRHHIEDRYIELFRSSNEELLRALGLSGGWGKKRTQRASMNCPSKCLLMRGLPYSCTEADITKFFQEVDITPIRIHRKADGAEAYVEFYCIRDTDRAMERHRNYIGRRYIELFRVSFEDMARTVGLPINSLGVQNMMGLPFAPYVSPALSLQSLENVRRAVEQQKQQLLMQQAQQQSQQQMMYNHNGNVQQFNGHDGGRVRYGMRSGNPYLGQQQQSQSQQLPPSSYFPQQQQFC